MRIALVSREVVPFYGAGIGTYAAAMARAWAESGHQVHFVTLPHAGLAERAAELLPGVRIHPVDLASGLAPRMRFAFQRHAMAVLETLRAVHRETPLSYIEFPDYGAEGSYAIAARRTGRDFDGAVMCVRLHTPTRECRDLNLESSLDEEGATLEAAEEDAIRCADAVISPSHSLLNILEARLAPQRPGAVWTVVPYPFDRGTLSGLDGDAAPPDPAPTILYAGRLERRKGVDLLLDAAVSLLGRGTKARFRFVGADTFTGPGQSSMRRSLEARIPPGATISFDGPLPRHALGPAIRAARDSGGLCCFPSRWENYPNVCLEAMALGAPVLGSDAGGMSEIIEHEVSGLLFRSGDATDLARSIARLLDDAPLRARLIANAPERVRTLCEPTRVVQQVLDIIPRAAQSPTSPLPTLAVTPSYELHRTLATSDAAWFLITPSDAQLDPRTESAVREAIARNPGAHCITSLAVRGPFITSPAGFHRDLLAVYDSGPRPLLAVNRAAAQELVETDRLHAGSPWLMNAALAMRGLSCLLIPEPLATFDSDVPASDRTRLELSLRFPDLAESPGRSLRMLEALRAAEAVQAEKRLAAAEAQITELKSAPPPRPHVVNRLRTALGALKSRPAEHRPERRP